MSKQQWAIIWFGRGGQGAVTASNIVAKAAFLDGFRFVQSFPFFGPERRGAPVKAYTRIGAEPINDFTSIHSSDIFVIFDQKLLYEVDLNQELNEGGFLIVNAPGIKIEERSKNRINIFIIDANAIAFELDLKVAGLPVVNTCMLGAFSKATGLVKLETILKVVKESWSGEFLNKNLRAVELAYEKCKVI
ncbi:MAG: 2-oxoacid:acceptor oxidoreductase family protein [Candidatus Odinarchaeum yellowstonii]|uniref:pyruvate synthase n=1 Tax=Odinarchaeota yellowstonii (strain LCB_4) TaxID=1841599 RepID=A0AAF0D3F1_ODILC|nr:MAG: 2-oxoacid:acceptor oxidoreductase family protein [Candidatus Odinarchaeum yellowstonii]